MNTKYLKNRENVLNYTNEDMNLTLNNNEQVYLAIIDIPTGSGIVDNEVMSIALIFGLNTHVYFANGNAKVDLEKNDDVMQLMQSVLISSHQALPHMKKVDDYEIQGLDSKHIYLKTSEGVFYTPLNSENQAQNFLEGMTNMLIREIGKYM